MLPQVLFLLLFFGLSPSLHKPDVSLHFTPLKLGGHADLTGGRPYTCGSCVERKMTMKRVCTLSAFLGQVSDCPFGFTFHILSGSILRT